ncbi:MAG: response regulator transcription factor [Acetobacteraceae bacterium]|nr:response regulator transcription factor [Acetobacteraceae bacterium]
MDAQPLQVLVVDDDENIGELVRLYLAREGFALRWARDGEEALRMFSQSPPHLVILDIMLPGLDGWEVLRRIRALSRVPIIMLSAKGERYDRILGLDLGADDYLVKPFDPYELVARVRAVLRRAGPPRAGEAGPAPGGPGAGEPPRAGDACAGPAGTVAGPAVSGAESGPGAGAAAPGAPAAGPHAGGVRGERVEWGGLVIDKGSWMASLDGRELQLTRKELELLFYLASHPNRAFTRDQLLEQVWGYDFAGESRTVDAHIKRLRQKLGGGGDRWRIATVWGVGYRFEVR